MVVGLALEGIGRWSLVSYLLGITRIDPVEEELFFERFLSLKREDPPDIDLDVDDESRQALLRSLKDHFGSDHLCLIRTASTYGFKGRLGKLAESSVLMVKEYRG